MGPGGSRPGLAVPIGVTTASSRSAWWAAFFCTGRSRSGHRTSAFGLYSASQATAYPRATGLRALLSRRARVAAKGERQRGGQARQTWPVRSRACCPNAPRGAPREQRSDLVGGDWHVPAEHPPPRAAPSARALSQGPPVSSPHHILAGAEPPRMLTPSDQEPGQSCELEQARCFSPGRWQVATGPCRRCRSRDGWEPTMA